MSKVLGAIAAFLTVVIVGTTIAAAQVKAPRRTALVIGNADYSTSPLSNPVNDARAMAAMLRKLGFDVIERINADQAGMKRAIWDYGKKLRQGGVGLFYFAGHGVQVGGENYLIPLKARIEGQPDLELEGIRVTRVLAEMEKANNGMNIVILDACRNNPFARSFRSVSRGLAHMSAPYGTLLAYATAPGSVAADGDGDNGLYTSEILGAINTPGLRVEDVFKRVRRKVRKKSRGKQVPWESTSIEGDFYFVPAKPKPPKPVVVEKAPVINLIPPPAVSGDALEVAFWESIKGSKYPADYNAYLRRYPTGAFAAQARAKLQALQPAPKQVAKQAPQPKATAPAAKKSETKVAALTVGRPRFDILEMERNFVTLDRITMRSEPTPNAAAVGTIPNASAVVVTGKLRDEDWFRVDRRRGPDAFVRGDQIAPVGASEIAYWERIKRSRNPKDFRRFRKKYPRSAVAPVAKAYEDRLLQRRRPTQQAARNSGAAAKRERSPAGQAFRDAWGETRGAFGSAMNFFSGKKSKPKPAQSSSAAALDMPDPVNESTDIASAQFAPNSQVRVTPSRLNVRSGPGGRYGVMFSVSRNDVLQVKAQNGGWVRVETPDGRLGWVAARLVAPQSPTQAVARSAGEPKTVTRSVAPDEARKPAVKKAEDPIERLSRLKRLHEQGLISDDEYAAKRRDVLSKL